MAFLALSLALLASLAPLVNSLTVPSPSSIDSDVTLLYYNDLDCECLTLSTSCLTDGMQRIRRQNTKAHCFCHQRQKPMRHQPARRSRRLCFQ